MEAATGGKREERGAAAVEFALALPLLIILIFGVLEFGLVIHAKGIITQASREGARYGVTYTTTAKTAAAIQTYVQNYLEGAGFTGAIVTVTPDPPPSTSGSLLNVRVDYTYNFLVLPDFITQMAGALNLSAVTTMRME